MLAAVVDAEEQGDDTGSIPEVRRAQRRGSCPLLFARGMAERRCLSLRFLCPSWSFRRGKQCHSLAADELQFTPQLEQELPRHHQVLGLRESPFHEHVSRPILSLPIVPQLTRPDGGNRRRGRMSLRRWRTPATWRPRRRYAPQSPMSTSPPTLPETATMLFLLVFFLGPVARMWHHIRTLGPLLFLPIFVGLATRKHERPWPSCYTRGRDRTGRFAGVRRLRQER